MERYSWRVHFRNQSLNPARLALHPRFGEDKVSQFRRLFVGVCEIRFPAVETGLAPSYLAAQDAASRVSTRNQGHGSNALNMQASAQIRRWRLIGPFCVLCLALQGLAMAESETSTPPKKPAQTSAKPAPKSKPSTSAHATSKRTSSHTTTNSHAKKGSKQVAKRKRGQQAIDPTRAREIQTALIREHYMQGEPTGSWDAGTQAAMQRYQADQGWQSKTTPDSRALIKLGLGPSHDHLLNPESAMTTSAAPAGDPKAATKQTPPQNNLPQQ
jgi:hypothetical protein